MIKLVNIVFFSICVFCGSFAQATIDTVFYNEALEKVPQTANYNYYGIREYNKKGIGKTTYYTKADLLYARFEEKRGKKQGSCIWFHENGEIKIKGQYRNNCPRGARHYYDFFGEHQRTEIYNWRGKVEAEYYFAEGGQKVFTIADRLSTFANYRNESKGFIAMGQYIDEHLERPDFVEKLDQPRVLVSFLINPDGELVALDFSSSENPKLNAVVRKLLEEMPAWRPAKYNGEKVYSEYSVTVIF